MIPAQRVDAASAGGAPPVDTAGGAPPVDTAGGAAGDPGELDVAGSTGVVVGGAALDLVRLSETKDDGRRLTRYQPRSACP